MNPVTGKEVISKIFYKRIQIYMNDGKERLNKLVSEVYMINIIVKMCWMHVCVSARPFDAIDIKDDKAVILDNCTVCGSCVSSCNFDAIDFQKESDDTIDKSEYHGIWVFGEQEQRSITRCI